MKRVKGNFSYREFLFRDVYNGKECGFKVQAKTDDEVVERALMHQEIAHGVMDISPDLEKEIKVNIRPVSADVHQF